MIIVTGSKGVIGSAVVSKLLGLGEVVNPISRDLFDLSAENSLVEFVNERPEVVIHLAAAVPHSPYYPDTETSAELTQRIDKCVFDAVQEWDCRVVYASGCSLYDRRSSNIMYEHTPIYGGHSSPYFKAKADGEALFSELRSYTIMRVSAPIGPKLPSAAVARRFFDLTSKGKTISLWGSGAREQNYVDVRDIADVMIRASFSGENGLFNIAADTPTTMYFLAQTMVRVLGKGSIEFVDIDDPLEYEYARYSNKRARNLLGWEPKASLEDSIKSMCGATV